MVHVRKNCQMPNAETRKQGFTLLQLVIHHPRCWWSVSPEPQKRRNGKGRLLNSILFIPWTQKQWHLNLPFQLIRKRILHRCLLRVVWWLLSRMRYFSIFVIQKWKKAICATYSVVARRLSKTPPLIDIAFIVKTIICSHCVSTNIKMTFDSCRY